MNVGQAWTIFLDIGNPNYSDDAKGLAIYKIIKCSTRSNIKKDIIYDALLYLLRRVYILPGESEGGDAKE